MNLLSDEERLHRLGLNPVESRKIRGDLNYIRGMMLEGVKRVKMSWLLMK